MAGISYNTAYGKVGVSLGRRVAGQASKARPQQTDEGLWKAKRAIARRDKTRMRLHPGWRVGGLNVYSTGRGGVGVRDGDV